MSNTSKNQLILTYTITIILAACSLFYELLIAETISFFAANRVVWLSLTVGLYLGSMGLGVFFLKKICKNKNPFISLIKVEVLLSLLGGISVLLIHVSHMFFGFLAIKYQYNLGTILFFFISLFLIISIGFLSGLELPLLIKIGNNMSHPKNITNRILSTDYLGALIAGIIFPLVFLPNFELITISFIIAFINISVAIYILSFVLTTDKIPSITSFGTLASLSILIIFLLNSNVIQQYFLQKFYYFEESSTNLYQLFKPSNTLPKIERFHSPYQKIDFYKILGYNNLLSARIVEEYSAQNKNIPAFDRSLLLYINGDLQDWIDFEEYHHEYFAHIPMHIHQKIPKNVLILGAGDGFLLKEILKYEDIASITLIDLDKEIIRLAKEHPALSTKNNNAFNDKRVEVIIADAYNFMRNCTRKFDAIYTDFPIATDYNLNKLYTYEFYHFLNKALNEDGFVASNIVELSRALRSDQYSLSDQMTFNNLWNIHYATITSAGFNNIIPFVNRQEPTKTAKDMLFHEVFENPKNQDMWNLEQGLSKKEFINNVLYSFIDDTFEVFLYLSKSSLKKVTSEFIAPEIPLYVFNPEKLKFSLNVKNLFPKKINPSLINSIMKPTLLKKNYWQLKLP